MKSSATARVTGLHAYDCWKAAHRHYETLLAILEDERRLSRVIARGRHLNLCVLIAVASGRAEAARQRLVTWLDQQSWFENDLPSSTPATMRPSFSRQAPC